MADRPLRRMDAREWPQPSASSPCIASQVGVGRWRTSWNNPKIELAAAVVCVLCGKLLGPKEKLTTEVAEDTEVKQLRIFRVISALSATAPCVALPPASVQSSALSAVNHFIGSIDHRER